LDLLFSTIDADPDPPESVFATLEWRGEKWKDAAMAGFLPIVSLQNCMRMSPIVFVLTLSHTAAISLLKALKNVKKQPSKD
jgi:hypothetical protein